MMSATDPSASVGHRDLTFALQVLDFGVLGAVVSGLWFKFGSWVWGCGSWGFLAPKGLGSS